MQMTRAISMADVICPGCKTAASGQTQPGGPCLNCQKVPRAERRPVPHIDTEPQSVRQAQILVLFGFGCLVAIVVTWLASGGR